MKNTSNLTLNQRKILDFVRLEGPVSRAELTQLSGLTPGAITRLTKELIYMGLVKEGDRRTGLRGQPALPLEINRDGGVAIGIALPYGRIDMVALDYQGNCLINVSVSFEGKSQSELNEALDLLLAKFDPPFAQLDLRLVGIGLALSGYTKSGSYEDIVLPESLNWMDVGDLSARLVSHFKADIYVENTANAAALGELCVANQSDLSDLVAINLGYGVGAGLVLSKQMHRGLKGYAGEIGGCYPSREPRPSAYDLVTSLRAAGRGVDEVSDLAKLDIDNDQIVSAWIKRAAAQLLPAIHMIQLLIAPQKIVVTGMLPEVMCEKIVMRLSQDLSIKASNNWTPPVELAASQLGTFSSVFGAAWLPIRNEGQFQ